VTHTENKAERVKITGYNAKAGANYNFTDNHNGFVNVGTYSRAPYFNFIYVGTGSNPNAINRDLKNEEANAVEVGYGFRNKNYRIKVNAYYTEFKNRSLQSPLLTATDGSQYRALITGQGALHKGIEVEATTRVIKNLEVSGFGSFGDWKWKGNASAVIRDELTNTDKTVNVYSDGLYVGDQPQTQIGGNARYQLTKKIDLGSTFTYNDKYYAYYDPSSRTNSAVTQQAYKLSGFGVLDMRAGYKFMLGNYDSYLQVQVYNVLDRVYWVEANDGSGTSAGTLANGFQGWGRNANFSLKVNF
jgi:iron complex outermembrane receptor protein